MTISAQIIKALGPKGEELQTAVQQFEKTEHYGKIEKKLEAFQNSSLFDLEAAKIFALLGYAQEFENNKKAKEEYLENATQVKDSIRCITGQEDEATNHVLSIVDGFIYDKNDYQEPVVKLDYPGLMKSIYERFPVIKDSYFHDAVLTLWGKLCYGTASFPDTYTALMWAADRGRTAVVNELINAGADVKAKDQYGLTALRLAVDDGHAEVVIKLLHAGADVDAKDECGWTALILSAYRGHTAIVTELLNAGADVHAKKDGWTALMYAVDNGHAEVVIELLHAGADVNAKDRNDWTALMLAACNGRTAVVSELLKKGAELEIKNKEGWTALMSAAANGHTAVVTKLLKKGADIEAKDEDGYTALMSAAANRRTAVVTELLHAGANVDARSKDGCTALKAADVSGNAEIFAMIEDVIKHQHKESMKPVHSDVIKHQHKESMKPVHSELSELFSSSNLQNAAPANASIHCSSLAMGALTVAVVGVAMAYSQSYSV